MKKLMVLEIILIFVLCGTGVSAADEAKIRTSYKDFLAALLSGDGPKASQFVCKDVFGYYDDARKLALYGDTDTIEKEPQIKILVIFQLRYLLSKLELDRMSNGRDVFAWGVSSGLVQKDVLKQFALNKIQINGDQAFASILKNGAPVKDLGFNFKKESGVWKIDMMKLLTLPNVALDKIRQQAGKTKIELAMYIMEEKYGKPVSSDILEGSAN